MNKEQLEAVTEAFRTDGSHAENDKRCAAAVRALLYPGGSAGVLSLAELVGALSLKGGRSNVLAWLEANGYREAMQAYESAL